MDEEKTVGKVLSIPCRSIDEDSTGDVWAVPVKDHGVFTGLTFVFKKGPFATTPPSYDSKTAFRIWDKITEELEWYVLGSRTDFFTSCSTCCASINSSYVPMPGVNSDGTPNLVWRIAPIIELGDMTDGSGNMISYWGIPTLNTGYNYFPYGSYNNIAFPDAPTTGFSTPAALLAWVQANCSSVGSPAVSTLTWSLQSESSGIGSLKAVGGNVGDTLGLSVVAVPST